MERDVRAVLPEADVHGFEAAEDAWAFAEETGCDVLLCAIELYCGSGIRLAEKIRERFPRANLIFVTVCSEQEHAREVPSLRPSGYLTKPTTRDRLGAELRDLRYPVEDGA